MKSEKNKAFYLDKKAKDKCVVCGKQLLEGDEYITCKFCYLKKRITSLDSRIRKLEKYFDLLLKQENMEK